MKKLMSITLLLVFSFIFVIGCEKEKKEEPKLGNYKEGTYFGFDIESKYNATIYVNEDGFIKSVFIDAAYVELNDECKANRTTGKFEGVCVASSKQMLGDDYNMKPASPIEKEWFEQVQVIADKVIIEQGINWMVLKYKDKDGNITTTMPEGQSEADKIYQDAISGATIHVIEVYNAIIKALEQAKK